MASLPRTPSVHGLNSREPRRLKIRKEVKSVKRNVLPGCLIRDFMIFRFSHVLFIVHVDVRPTVRYSDILRGDVTYLWSQEGWNQKMCLKNVIYGSYLPNVRRAAEAAR